MIHKSESVTVRLTPVQKQRLLAIAAQLGNEGNVTAGFRWCVQNAPVKKLKIEAINVQSNRG